MKLLYSTKFLALAVIIIISIPALKSLKIQGFYTSHDGETHTARIAQYYQAAKDGQIPPRLAGTLYNGLGSPIFVYIYPAPYALGALVHSTDINYENTFKLLMGASFIFSGVFTYLWLKAVFNSDKAALLGSVFYVWAPYRFSLIYVRGSISESFAYTFLPLSLYALTKLAKFSNIKWVSISALSLSFLLLSQNLVALISIPVIALYTILLSVLNKSPKYLLLSIISGIWAVLISSFTYTPILLERKFIRIDEIIQVAYPDHFVSLKQLIYSPWGYGFDLPKTAGDELSFQIGLAHLLVLFILGLTIVLQVAKSAFKRKIKIPFIKTPSRQEAVLLTLFALTFAISVFLMIDWKPTLFVWQSVESFKIIDIPWRFLGLTTLAAAFFAAYLAKSVKPGILIILLIIAVLVANRNHLRINKSVTFGDDHFSGFNQTATQYNEFTPKWRETTRTPIGFDSKTPVEVIRGEADISDIYSSSNHVSFLAFVKSEESAIRINKFYFPNWQISVDEEELEAFEKFTVTSSSQEFLEKEKDTSGLMQLTLQRGNHKVMADYKETNLRLIANFISLIAAAAAVGFLVKNAKK